MDLIRRMVEPASSLLNPKSRTGKNFNSTLGNSSLSSLNEEFDFESAGHRVLLANRLHLSEDLISSTPNSHSHINAIWRDPVTKAFIYVGDYHVAKDSSVLLSLGIKSVVNCTRPSPSQRGELPNFHESSPHNFRYYSFPVATWRSKVKRGQAAHEDSIIDFFTPVFTFIEASLKRGDSVLIHCLAGAHRAGTTGISVLMHFARFHKKEAIMVAKRIRPIIDPVGGLIECLSMLDSDMFGDEPAPDLDALMYAVPTFQAPTTAAVGATAAGVGTARVDGATSPRRMAPLIAGASVRSCCRDFLQRFFVRKEAHSSHDGQSSNYSGSVSQGDGGDVVLVDCDRDGDGVADGVGLLDESLIVKEPRSKRTLLSFSGISSVKVAING